MGVSKMFTFVLRDKGTNNQGWWLKISNVDELCEYYTETAPTRNGRVFENYMYGKEWNFAHEGYENESHCPHSGEATLTDAVVRYSCNNNLNILQGIQGFTQMVALQQLEEIKEHGIIYINRVGGYTWKGENDVEYAFVKREKLVFPDFKKDQIKVSKFPYGSHYYAYIGDLQVKDGDKIKWNTYDEAYRQACLMIDA